MSGNHQTPDTFLGSETGTDVTLGFGSYQVAETINATIPDIHVNEEFSTGVIHPDETKTCTITSFINRG